MCFENCGEFRIAILNRTLKQQNMRPIFSDLTYKIVAFQDINEIQSDEIIQWAIEMIELGYRSENLFMLASFEKKSNFYEIENAENSHQPKQKNGCFVKVVFNVGRVCLKSCELVFKRMIAGVSYAVHC